MRFFKRKPAPEAALVQQLMDQLRQSEEQNRTLQKELQREQEHGATVQMALEVAVDNSWSIQQKMDIETMASKQQAKALREKQGELDMANVQIQRLVQERTELSVLCLQNSKIFSLQDQLESKTKMFKMVTDALKSSYGQLKVTTTRLEAEVSMAKQNLEVSRQETSAPQNDLTEERKRSGVLLEELNKLQEEMQLLRRSAETEKVQGEMSIEELSKFTVLQNELREEQGRKQQLQEEVTLYKENRLTLVQELRQMIREVEVKIMECRQQKEVLKRSAEDARVQAEHGMEALSKHITALQNELKEEKGLNKELQSKLCKLQEEKEALKTECEKSDKKAMRSMEQVTVLQNELGENQKRNQALQKEVYHFENVQKDLKEVIRQTEEKNKKLLEETHAMKEECGQSVEEAQKSIEYLRKKLHLKILNSTHLEREVTGAKEMLEEQRRKHQVELQSLRAALEDMKNHLKKTEQRSEEQKSQTQPGQMAPQIQSTTTELEKVLTKTEGGPQTKQLQTEGRQVLVRRTKIVLIPKN